MGFFGDCALLDGLVFSALWDIQIVFHPLNMRCSIRWWRGFFGFLKNFSERWIKIDHRDLSKFS